MSAPLNAPITLRRAVTIWLLLSTLLAITLLVCPLVGPTRINLSSALSAIGTDEFNPDAQILMTARLPRVLFGAVAGAILSLAGAVYQTLLRNDLADPYTLGVSGGASFGALLVMNIVPPPASLFLLPFSAFLFSSGSVGAVYTMTRRRGMLTHPSKLLLAGVTLNLLFSSGILLIQYLSDPYQTYNMVRWMMGGVDVLSLRITAVVAAIGAIGATLIIRRAKVLNMLSFGEMTAAHLGVDVERNRTVLLAASSIMAALVVAYAGPIGFIGLVVPHIVRLLVGPDHRVLLPSCALAGATLLVVCDTMARTILPSIPGMPKTELPVGIVTALLGAPFFLWLLFRQR